MTVRPAVPPLDYAAVDAHDAAAKSTLRCPAGPTGKPVVPAGGRRSRLLRGDRGASPVELALLFPLIIGLLFSSIQVSLYFLAQSEAQAAAQAGVNAARGYNAPQGAGPSAVHAYLSSGHGWFIQDPPPTPPPSAPPAGAPDVKIVVTGHVMSLFPGWKGWGIAATANAPAERTTAPMPPPPGSP